MKNSPRTSGALGELKARLPQLEDAAAAVSRADVRERVLRAENDFTFFCEYYLSSYFSCRPAEYQRILYDVIQTRELTTAQCERLKAMVPGRFRDTFRPTGSIEGIVDVEPRGHGKSTRMTFAFPLWCLLYRKKSFIVVIGASKEDAELQMSNIRTRGSLRTSLRSIDLEAEGHGASRSSPLRTALRSRQGARAEASEA